MMADLIVMSHTCSTSLKQNVTFLFVATYNYIHVEHTREGLAHCLHVYVHVHVCTFGSIVYDCVTFRHDTELRDVILLEDAGHAMKAQRNTNLTSKTSLFDGIKRSNSRSTSQKPH